MLVSSMSITDAEGADVELIIESPCLRLIQQVSGLQGTAAPRGVARPKPNRHGEIIDTRYLGEQITTIEGQVVGDGPAEVWREFNLLQEAIWASIAEDQTLKWTQLGSDLELQSLVRLADGPFDAPLIADAYGNMVLPYQVSFRRGDPRSFTQQLNIAEGLPLSAAAGGLTFPLIFPFTFTGSGGGMATVNNTGVVPTPPVYKVHGACTNPEVLIVGNGKRIVLTGEIADGDFIELDVSNRTVRLNGITNRTSLLDFQRTDWSELETGSESIRLLASSFNVNARVDVFYRPAYT